MPRRAPSSIATPQQYDLLREAQGKLNEALTIIGLAEQCGHDCQEFRQKAQAAGKRLDAYMANLFPDGQRPRG